VLAVTRPDKRRGRRAPPTPTPVKQAAERLGIPVGHDVDGVVGCGAELGVVVAFGRLIKAHVLAAVPMVNVHFSLLPRWRGAAPVERAILAGDAVTGVCLMKVDEGLDTGPVYRRVEVPIGPEETALQLTGRLARIGASLMVEALAEGLGDPEPQTGEATYAEKVTPEELRLDWRRPASELHRVVRIGRAWTTWRGRRLLVLEARVLDGGEPRRAGELAGTAVQTAAGLLQLVRVQPEGRPAMVAEEWLKGARPQPGEALGA
jgi:methionyl-tRNA formyltransferase